MGQYRDDDHCEDASHFRLKSLVQSFFWISWKFWQWKILENCLMDPIPDMNWNYLNNKLTWNPNTWLDTWSSLYKFMFTYNNELIQCGIWYIAITYSLNMIYHIDLLVNDHMCETQCQWRVLWWFCNGENSTVWVYLAQIDRKLSVFTGITQTNGGGSISE